MKSVKSKKSAAAPLPAASEVESGTRLLKLGLTQEAEHILKTYLERRPKDANALHVYGLVLHAQGRLEEACEFITRAIARDAQRAVFHFNLGLSLAAQGRSAEAVNAFQKAVSLQPRFEDAWFNMAVLSSQHQDFSAAEIAYRKTLELNPSHSAAMNNLGDMLGQSGRHKEAAGLLRRALAVRPDFSDAKYNLARAILDEHPGEAARLLQEVVRSRPALVDAYRLQAKAFAKNAEHEAAQEVLVRAIKNVPGVAGLHNDLGLIYLEQGKLAPAKAEFRKAIALDPDQAYALYNLAFIEKSRGDTELLGHIQRVLSREGSVRQDESVLLHFAAGHLLEAERDFERAFKEFDFANSIAGASYDREQTESFFDAIKQVFTPEFFARSPAGIDDPLPVFIVGMPRSGTTLVEQIVSSHAQAQGAGELLWFNQQAHGLSDLRGTSGTFPESVIDMAQDEIQRLAQAYLTELRRRGGEEALRISDKMPGNFVNLGLIAMLLPGAKIIHCQRDPLDTCLSSFTSYFTGYLPYTYNLEDLGHYYCRYQDLMAHWNEVLPLPIYNLQYERLIADPATEIRKLIEFLGLPWDERCLEPHLADRVVATASSVQVREPIYRKSLNRSTRFEPHLEPLKQSLNRHTLRR